MFGPSMKPSQRVCTAAVIAPVSAGAVVNSGWVDMAQFQNILAIVQLGVMQAGALVDAKLQQAQDNAGTGAKDVGGKAIVQFAHATPDDGKQALINMKQDDLDVNNGFRFVRLAITPSVAASLIGGLILGFDSRYAPADLNAAATQAQIVG